MSAKHRQRQQAAELAARHIRQGGLDMASARHKAARQLGLDLREGNAGLPSAREIEQALATQLELFGADDRGDNLQRKRLAAAEAMAALQQFSPRLCGAVLDGSAQHQDPVVLHLHADSPEEVAVFVHEQQLPARLCSARLQLADGQHTLACWKLVADDTVFELWVLPSSALQHPPRQPLGHAALPRANLKQLRQLIASTGGG